MKTVVISWRSPKWYRENALSRRVMHTDDYLLVFMMAVLDDVNIPCGCHHHRLTKCGKLIAREATYLGV